MPSILDEQPIGHSILDNEPRGSILDPQPQGSILGGGAPRQQAKPKPHSHTVLDDLGNGAHAAQTALANAGRWLAQGTASNASGLSQVLDYQRARSQEAMFHQGSSDKNRKALRQKLGMQQGYEDPTLFGNGDHKGIPIPPWLQHTIRGAEDTVIDLGSDPLSYETAAIGPLLKLGAKGVGAAAQAFSRVAPETAEGVAATGRTLQNHFGLGGAHAVKLERARGKAAKDTTLGASAHSDSEAAHVNTLLQRTIKQTIGKMKPADQAVVLRVLNGEMPLPAAGPLRDAILKIRKTTDDAFYIQGTPGTQRVMPYVRSRVNTNVHQPGRPQPVHDEFEQAVPDTTRTPRNQIVRVRGQALPAKPYDLPENLQEFATVPGAAPLSKFRRDYVTGLRPDTIDAADHEGFVIKPEEYQNPNLRERGDLKIDPQNPQQYIDALLRSMGNASRAVGSVRLNKRLRDAFGGEIPDEVSAALAKEFGPTGDGRKDIDKALDLARKVTGYGKAAQTQLTPFHAANVSSLHLLNNAERTPQVLSRFAKLMKNRNNPEAAYELMRPGIERGAIGPAKDQESYFGKIPLLGQWSKLMGDITWGLDNAAKTEYAKRLGNGYSAGRRASEDLIDYRNSSDFSKQTLSLLSKFPTYRSQLLPAVLKSIARDPRRVDALMRASGGVFTGDEADIGNGHKLKSYTAVADAGRGVGDTMGYARSTLSEPQKAVLTKLGIGRGRNGKYFTYGKDVDIKYLLNYLSGGLPEGRDILSETGNGIFPGRGLANDLLFSNTGTVIK